MQKIQILRGTPGPSFSVLAANLARKFALERVYKTNLHTNGDAEADSNWTNYGTPAVNSRSTTRVVTGTYSRLLTPNAANEGVTLDVFTTEVGVIYRHTFQVYPDDGTIVTSRLLRGDGTLLIEQIHSGLAENAWNIVTFEAKELAGGALASLTFHSGVQTSGDFYFADVFGSKLSGANQYAARKASGARIRVEDNDIRYAFGGTVPTMAATAKLGHLVADPADIILDNFDAIHGFRYVNNVSGSVGILNVTMEF